MLLLLLKEHQTSTPVWCSFKKVNSGLLLNVMTCPWPWLCFSYSLNKFWPLTLFWATGFSCKRKPYPRTLFLLQKTAGRKRVHCNSPLRLHHYNSWSTKCINKSFWLEIGEFWLPIIQKSYLETSGGQRWCQIWNIETQFSLEHPIYKVCKVLMGCCA